MFSGTDGDRNYPTQWALNPSAYQNVSNDQVDWAALAQQWIMMKETCPPEQVPPAPPPPPIGPVKKDKENSNAGSSLIEGGEAPMEVENDKEDSDGILDSSIPPASWTGPASGPGSWNWQQQQWGWNTGWTGPPNVSGATPTTAVPPLALAKNALLPTPFTFPTSDATGSNYSGSRSNSYASGYWTSGQSSNRMKGSKKHRGESDEESEPATVTLDAAKRRQLPAWIREGLEKMEREKQKQLDKEREAREREEFLKRKKQEEEEVRKVMTDSGMVVLPSKSKFESDSEDSGKEDKPKTSFKRESPPKKIIKKRESVEIESPVRSKSKEDRIQDVMLTVRRMMTEILLDVTTDEIENICQEELKRYRVSASAMNPQKTPALASLTGKLGLGIYGESGSSGSESEHSNADDSDSNLKETIRRRKAEFLRTEREIDAHALDVERRQAEQERIQREREQHTSSGNNVKDGERYSQVDTANSHYGHSEKPTPRKSRFHDGPINENTQLPKTDDYIYAGSASDKYKSSNKNNTNIKSRKRDDKSSSSRSRTSSESKSGSSSESESSGSHHTEHNRRRSVSDEHRKSEQKTTEKYKRKRDSHGRESRSESVEYNNRSGKVFKDPKDSKESTSKRGKNGRSSEDRAVRYSDKHHASSPEYKSSRSGRKDDYSKSSRHSYSPLSKSKRSHSKERSSRSREQSSRSYRRSRSRDRRSKSRHRSRSTYSRDRSRDRYSRRSNSREYQRRKRSSSRDRRRRSRSSYDRRDRSRSRNRSRSRDYHHRRSRSRSQQRGKKSHRH